MMNLLFSFFLLSLTFNAGLWAMDPPQIDYDHVNYFYYRSNEPNTFRCPKQGPPLFEHFSHGQWSAGYSVQYSPANSNYFYFQAPKVYTLIPINPPLITRQIMGRGGSFQRKSDGKAPCLQTKHKAPCLPTSSIVQKIKLPGKMDFSEQTIEDYLFEITENGFGALRCDRILNDDQAKFMLELAQYLEWKTVRIIVNSDYILNNIIDLARIKKVKNLTLEIHNISDEAMANLAQFLVDSTFLEEVIIKAQASRYAELIIGVVKEYSKIPRLHFSMPIESDKLHMLIDAFLNNNKLTPNNKLEVSNYKIDESWFIDIRKYYDARGITIQDLETSENRQALLLFKRMRN